MATPPRCISMASDHIRDHEAHMGTPLALSDQSFFGSWEFTQTGSAIACPNIIQSLQNSKKMPLQVRRTVAPSRLVQILASTSVAATLLLASAPSWAALGASVTLSGHQGFLTDTINGLDFAPGNKASALRINAAPQRSNDITLGSCSRNVPGNGTPAMFFPRHSRLSPSSRHTGC